MSTCQEPENVSIAPIEQDPVSIDWDTHFTKGWTDSDLWLSYMQARDAGEYFEMDCILRAQGADRRPVDARIWATVPQDLDLYEQHYTSPDPFLSAEREAEHYQLERLARLRDVQLTALPDDLPESLRKNSYFAHLIKIDPYVPGLDFMTTKEEYYSIQRGDTPDRVSETLGALRSPETGRDWATYVHTDNPMEMWTKVVAHLLQLGVPFRNSVYDTSICAADSSFVCGGMPFWWGVIGDVISRIGPLNFRSKHTHMAARPEEYSVKRFGEYLSMAFPEGSPMHGGFRAMHDAIARALAAAVLSVFDRYFILPSGNSVEYEVTLLAGNISDGRQWAAVHTERDNRAGIPLAKALGQRVAQEHLARLGTA